MKRSGNKRRHTDGHSDLQDDSLEEKKTNKQMGMYHSIFTTISIKVQTDRLVGKQPLINMRQREERNYIEKKKDKRARSVGQAEAVVGERGGVENLQKMEWKSAWLISYSMEREKEKMMEAFALIGLSWGRDVAIQ